MPKTEAGQVWRGKNARLTLDLHKDTKARWDEYAARLNMPTGRMVRMCVERCIAEDGTEASTATVEPDVAPDVSADQPVSSDV